MNKYKIELRRYTSINVYESRGFIMRVLHGEQIGNFNPIFCTYKNESHLVHSDSGDLSDPFRRDESYTDSLYIMLEQ